MRAVRMGSRRSMSRASRAHDRKFSTVARHPARATSSARPCVCIEYALPSSPCRISTRGVPGGPARWSSARSSSSGVVSTSRSNATKRRARAMRAQAVCRCAPGTHQAGPISIARDPTPAARPAPSRFVECAGKRRSRYSGRAMAETLRSICPLDCPDACSLDVKVEGGLVVGVDGAHDNPLTAGFICAKVRRFPEHMYGPERVLRPAVREGQKGSGAFRDVSWDEALDRVAAALADARDRFGGESILPFCYGGSNGYLTQDATDARLFRRLGGLRLVRTIRAAR